MVPTEDISQCHYPGLYEKYARITESGDEIIADLSEADPLLPGLDADVYQCEKGKCARLHRRHPLCTESRADLSMAASAVRRAFPVSETLENKK